MKVRDPLPVELISFTPEFHKSRLRLIYFSSIGILISKYPLTEKISLLGLQFEGLTGDTVITIFLVFAFVVFVDHLIRLIEETPALVGKQNTAHERYTEISNEISVLYSQIDRRFRAWESEKKDVLSAREILSNAGMEGLVCTETGTSFSDLVRRFEGLEENMLINASDIERDMVKLKKVGKKRTYENGISVIRVWSEFLSGSVVWLLFIYFAFVSLSK